jgi:hypothetical protein
MISTHHFTGMCLEAVFFASSVFGNISFNSPFSYDASIRSFITPSGNVKDRENEIFSSHKNLLYFK